MVVFINIFNFLIKSLLEIPVSPVGFAINCNCMTSSLLYKGFVSCCHDDCVLAKNILFLLANFRINIFIQ